MLEEQQEDLRKKRCADRYDSSESSDSGVAALSGGESLSSCGSSNNGDNLLASPPCSPASSGELIICDDHQTSVGNGNGNTTSRVDQLLHGTILTSGLSTRTSDLTNTKDTGIIESDRIDNDKKLCDAPRKEENNDELEKNIEDGASFVKKNQEGKDIESQSETIKSSKSDGLFEKDSGKAQDGKVAIVNPLNSTKNEENKTVIGNGKESGAEKSSQESNASSQHNKDNSEQVDRCLANSVVVSDDVSPQKNLSCINNFPTSNSLVQFTTFPSPDSSKVLPTATANGALVNGLLLQQQNLTAQQNIKFLQCVTNSGIVNGQVRICNNPSSILLNNTGYPMLKNNTCVLGAIQNNLATAGGAGGQVAVTTWNGSPILINANALATNLNQLNNLGSNENAKKCNAAIQSKNQMAKICQNTDTVKLCQNGAGVKRQSPVKEQQQTKCQGSQNNIITPSPAKKPRSACKTEQQKHNTRTAQHSCCPNKNKPGTKQDHIKQTSIKTTSLEKSFNIDPVVIDTLQKNCVSIQQITTPASPANGCSNKTLVNMSNNKNVVTINTQTQLIMQQNGLNSKICTNNREITNYFKAQVKPQRRASDNQLLTTSAKLVATQSDYLAMLTSKTHANQQVLLEKRSYDVRTLTLATPTTLNNNNQLANHNNNITSKPPHLMNNGIASAQQQNSFKIGGIEVSLKHQPDIACKPLSISNQVKITNGAPFVTKQIGNRQLVAPAMSKKPRGRPCVNIAPRIAKKPKCIAPKTDAKGVTAQPPVTSSNTAPQQQNVMAVSQQQAPTVAPQTVLLTTYTTNLPGQQNLTKLPAGLILNGTPSGIRFQQSPQPVYMAANPFLQPVYVTKPFLQQVGYSASQFAQFAPQFQNPNPGVTNGDIIGSTNFGSILTPDINGSSATIDNGVSQLPNSANESLSVENPVVSSITLDKSGVAECDNADQSLISEAAVSCKSIDESICDPMDSIAETASTFTSCTNNLPDNSTTESSCKIELNDSYNAKTDNTVAESLIDASIQKVDTQPEVKKIEVKEIEEPKSPKSLILERIQQKLDSENSFSSSFDEDRKTTESQEPRVIRFPAKFPCNGRYDSSRVNRDNYGAGRCVWDKCHGNYDTSSALLEHLQTAHVTTQTGPRYACHWRGCRVYGRESSSRRWLDAHVASAHAGSTRTLQCIVAGCRRRFSSQLALQRHVNNHFNEAEGNGANAKKSQEPHVQGSAAALKLIRKNGKKLRYRRQPWSARMFDFFDGGAMEGLQYRLLCTEALAGGARGTVLLRSDVLGRRLDSTGKAQVLVTWNPANILPDEWIAETDYTLTKEVDIRKLPTDSKCELSNHIESLTKKQEKVPRKQSRKHKRSDNESTSSSSMSASSSGYSSSMVASWFDP